MTAILEAQGLTKRFGPFVAVDNLSFELRRGEVLGFLGPNGSGKSTNMRMLTGFLRPDQGTALICGLDVQEDLKGAQRRIGYLPESAPVYPDMTPCAYLRYIAEAHGMDAKTAAGAVKRVVEMTNLAPVLQQPIETLSKGYKRRVGLAHALIHDPEVLVLDEPTDGLDPNQKHEMRALILRLSHQKAIIVSTHILEEVEAICTRTLIIASGRTVADCAPVELQARSRYHNAIYIACEKEYVASAEGTLAAIKGVTATEHAAESSGHVRVTALAESHQDIFTEVTTALRDAGLPFDGPYRSAASLDDIFRTLTQPDTDTGDERPTTVGSAAPPSARVSSFGQDIFTVCRRELAGYFATPTAYVFILTFLAGLTSLTFYASNFLDVGQANLDSFFQYHPWLYIFLIPALAMRLWAEEQKTGSIELLLTLPLRTSAAVFGKFVAAWIVVGVCLILSMSMWITVNYLGSPDNGAIAAAYLGSILLAGAYLAIGSFASILTSNQVIAFITAAAACFTLTVAGLRIVLDSIPAWAPSDLTNTLATFSVLEPYQGFASGVIDLRDITFLVSTIVIFLFATVVFVERKRSG